MSLSSLGFSGASVALSSLMDSLDSWKLEVLSHILVTALIIGFLFLFSWNLKVMKAVSVSISVFSSSRVSKRPFITS